MCPLVFHFSMIFYLTLSPQFYLEEVIFVEKKIPIRLSQSYHLNFNLRLCRDSESIYRSNTLLSVKKIQRRQDHNF